jgi:hypothetical protein
MRLLITFFLLALIFSARSVQAQSQQMEMKVVLDNFGDGSMEVKTHYSATGWLSWKANFGDHPDLVLRNLRREQAAREFYDYSLDKDDVNRTAVARMKGRAFAKMMKDGRYTLGPIKPLHFVTGTGREWIFNSSMSGGIQGNGVEQTLHVFLPPEATDAQILNPDSDYAELVYSVPHPSPLLAPLFLAAAAVGGVSFILIAISWMIPSARNRFRPAPSMATPNKMNLPPPLP